MSRTTHPNVQCESHTWRQHVSAETAVATRETNMWGRVVEGHAVRCHKHYVCDTCGQTRDDEECICDAEHADHCAILVRFRQAAE